MESHGAIRRHGTSTGDMALPAPGEGVSQGEKQEQVTGLQLDCLLSAPRGLRLLWKLHG